MGPSILDARIARHGRAWLYEAVAARWPAHRRPLGGVMRETGPLDLAAAILGLTAPQVLQCLLQDPDEAASFLLAQIDLNHPAGAEPQPDPVAAGQRHGPENGAGLTPLFAAWCATWCHDNNLPVWSPGLYGGQPSTQEEH